MLTKDRMQLKRGKQSVNKQTNTYWNLIVHQMEVWFGLERDKFAHSLTRI